MIKKLTIFSLLIFVCDCNESVTVMRKRR